MHNFGWDSDDLLTFRHAFVATVTEPKEVYITIWLVYSCCSLLEHGVSMKLYILLQFLNRRPIGRTPWTSDQPVVRQLLNTK
jgi:hypothetical protein